MKFNYPDGTRDLGKWFIVGSVNHPPSELYQANESEQEWLSRLEVLGVMPIKEFFPIDYDCICCDLGPPSESVIDGYLTITYPDCMDTLHGLETKRSNKRNEIHAIMKSVRDAGVIVSGVVYDTDGPARQAYSDMSRKLQSDPTYTVATWIASGDTIVTMDATKLAEVEKAGEQLIADVYAWQAAKYLEIGSAVDRQGIDAISTVYVSPDIDLSQK